MIRPILIIVGILAFAASGIGGLYLWSDLAAGSIIRRRVLWTDAALAFGSLVVGFAALGGAL